MANRNFQTSWVIGERIVDIAGSFVPLTGAGTVVASTVRGLGFGYAPSAGVMTLFGNVSTKSFLTTTPGIVRTGTGLYTVTLEDPYIEAKAVGCDLAVASASPNWAQPIEPIANLASSTAAPVISIQIINASGSAVDASSGGRLHFFVSLRDSTTQFQKP